MVLSGSQEAGSLRISQVIYADAGDLHLEEFCSLISLAGCLPLVLGSSPLQEMVYSIFITALTIRKLYGAGLCLYKFHPLVLILSTGPWRGSSIPPPFDGQGNLIPMRACESSCTGKEKWLGFEKLISPPPKSMQSHP